MKIEIWSDVVCPFCYIGKRKFEQALAQFAHKDEVEIEWRSFQLDPEAKYVPGADIFDSLAQKKGQSREWAIQMTAYVTSVAEEVGLKYDFSKVIPAGTLDAHRLTHLAAKHGLQDAMEERLFKAYFMEGQNIEDCDVLLLLAAETGLDASEVKHVLASDDFRYEVYQDIKEAEQIGVKGVPFFVIDRKYGVSGAQPVEVFLGALEKARGN